MDGAVLEKDGVLAELVVRGIPFGPWLVLSIDVRSTREANVFVCAAT